MEDFTKGRISKHWSSQAEARAIVAEHGCKTCTWKFPGEIFDMSGDLWCHHCVREFGREFRDTGAALIPKP